MKKSEGNVLNDFDLEPNEMIKRIGSKVRRRQRDKGKTKFVLDLRNKQKFDTHLLYL